MRMRICFLPKRREKSEEMVRPMAAAEEEGREREEALTQNNSKFRAELNLFHLSCRLKKLFS